MAKYTVKQGAGIIALHGKGYGAGDAIELTETQYKRLTDKVASEQAQAVSQGEAKPKELSFDELKALADEQGLEVEGTGKNGAIKKDDLLKALDK